MTKKTKKMLWWGVLGAAAGWGLYQLSLTGKAARKVEEQKEVAKAQSGYFLFPQ